MKITKKNIIITGIVLIVLLVIVRSARSNSQQKNSPANPNTGASTSTSTSGSKPKFEKVECTRSTVLKKGMKCSEVARAQNIINVYYKFVKTPLLAVDAAFGEGTEAAFLDVLHKKTGTANEVYAGVEKLLKELSK